MKQPWRMRIAALSILFVAGVAAQPVSATDVLSDEQRFRAIDMQKRKIDLSELLKTHKAVLINFWATWCALCKEEIPELAKLYAAQREDGIAIIGINVAESPRKVHAYAKKLGIHYPVVLDRESAIAEAWNVVGLPVSVLVHADGTLGGPYSGWTPELQRDVQALMTP